MAEAALPLGVRIGPFALTTTRLLVRFGVIVIALTVAVKVFDVVQLLAALQIMDDW